METQQNNPHSTVGAPRMILAMSRDNAIGNGGELLCHLRADLQRFKRLTLGHAIIMGRKTFDSLPKGALPGRRNIVITRNPAWEAPGAERAESLQQAIELAKESDEAPYIIGGGEIYRQGLPMVDRIELTMIEADYPEADTRLPELNLAEWDIEEEIMEEASESEPKFKFLTLRRK